MIQLRFLARLRKVIAARSDEEADLMVSLERKSLGEIVARHAIFLAVTIIATLFFKVAFLFVFLIMYTATSVVSRCLLKSLSRSRNSLVYLAALGVFVLRLSIYRSLLVYLWFYPEPAAHYVSMMMLISSVRLSVNLKSRVRSYIYLHSILDIIVFVILAMDFVFLTRQFDGSHVVALSFLSLIVYYVVTLVQNITYLKEVDQLEAQTRQAQKMEAVGRLTGGVAHDFNNLLTVVMGNLELHEVADDPAERKMLLSQTRDAAQRAAELTAQLLAFSRRSHLTQDTLEIGAIFNQVRSLSGRLLPANIRLADTIAEGTNNIRADATQLEVALLNLIINARDAMPDGGILSLVAKNHIGDRARVDGYVCIELTDQGGGIPDDLIDKVVEPFFTTKPVGEGSGLGLSMVKGFAEQSGGFMRISTERGVSTTISLCLPAVVAEPEDDQP